MTPFQTVIFAVLLLMVLIWFVCLGKLSRQLRDRHPDKYEQMGLANMWSRYNSQPVSALLRFLSRREDRALRDADISSLSAFMRWLFYAYFALFPLLMLSIMSQR